jgi:hypothetical protein
LWTPLSDDEAVEVNRQLALIDEAARVSWARNFSAPPPPAWKPNKVPPERRAVIGALVLDLHDKERSSGQIAEILSDKGIDVTAAAIRTDWIPKLKALRDYERRVNKDA